MTHAQENGGGDAQSLLAHGGLSSHMVGEQSSMIQKISEREKGRDLWLGEQSSTDQKID